ncbi:MAG: preprotein translocase subunit SecE [Actinobacteria bacterium]|nr:preprotein translocase subunit SecE [Actinomycetota bacterium]
MTDEEFAELEDRVDAIEATFETGDQDAIEEAEDELGQDIAARRRERSTAAAAPTRKGGLRFVAFLRASWAELQRVQWPDRRQVGQATAVVLGFVVVAGLYLGLADFVAQKVVDIII